MADEKKSTILSKFENSISRNAILSTFKKLGLNNLNVAKEFQQFLEINYPEIMDCFIPFEQFIKLTEV